MDIELNIDMSSSTASSVVMTDSTIIFKNSNLRLGKQGIHTVNENVSIYSNFYIEPKQIKRLQGIGRGASSIVYKALFDKDGTQILSALKCMNTTEKDKREQILNDLRTFFSGCHCQNLVQFYGCYYEQGKINQVIEFMDLGSLRPIAGLVSNGTLRIPESVLACIAIQITNGLLYIHKSKNLIHRDIKPENVLLNSKGQVKLADFGVSKFLDKTDGIAHTFVGTLIYMSPQRISNNTYGPNCDIWSFGLIMYELATGNNPYKFEKSQAPLSRVVQVIEMDTPQLGEKFTPEFRHFVSLCLQKDPKKRIETDQLINHPWLLKHAQCNDLPQWIYQLHQQKMI